ncbi:helix-turn-helix domain-containing protein [Streptococcus saliviloxodontae]|uniref:Transcriptional regulator with XRE-family HTH domain n=1 Tax=Streptococcus saliviloxodontae TaxID=1349416 RepID=A0ABS2PLQ7_9STRE|nr:helix-turn-helix domain-containing protein [Streptococcus saliviloxodontae]MBM7635728.1 transcriptional regulator with XRE-family HTH domain [Streptococcus saliviloxodontae]
MPKEFGKRVRTIREFKGITREELCGDEANLSVRQLVRIEAGSSAPSLQKALYIAKKLGVSILELTDGKSLELPGRYKELKYLILRMPTYMDENRLRLREEQFDEIYNVYYDNLPEEEQKVITFVQAKFEVYQTANINFGSDLVEDYGDQVRKKTIYQLNDLILIDLFLICSIVSEFDEMIFDERTFDRLSLKLVNQLDHLPMEDLFLLNNVLLSCSHIAVKLEKYSTLRKLLDSSKQVMTKNQDFQKMPIYHFLEWEYALYFLKDKALAQEHYNQAILFANMTGDLHLVSRLKEEWEKDISQ